MPDQSPVAVVAPPSVEQSETPLAAVAGVPADDAALVEADLLVEDVSIDGMCGVY